MNVGLRQRCFLSPWRFKLLMDVVIRRECKSYGEGRVVGFMHNDHKGKVNQLFFADSTVLVTNAKTNL